MILIATRSDNRTLIKPLNDVHEYVNIILSNDFKDDYLIINDDMNQQRMLTISNLFHSDDLSNLDLTPVQYQFVKDLFELT